MEFAYPAKIEKGEDGRFLVTFKNFSFGLTDGATLEEAKTAAVDCLETILFSCIKNKKKIPDPSQAHPGEHLIYPPAQTAVKTAAYIAASNSGLSNSEIARRMKINEKEVRRILNPMHPTKLPRIEEFLAKLGYGLSITMLEPAA